MLIQDQHNFLLLSGLPSSCEFDQKNNVETFDHLGKNGGFITQPFLVCYFNLLLPYLCIVLHIYTMSMKKSSDAWIRHEL